MIDNNIWSEIQTIRDSLATHDIDVAIEGIRQSIHRHYPEPLGWNAFHDLKQHLSFHSGDVALPEQVLLFCNPFRVGGRCRLNPRCMKHLCVSKEKACKLQHVAVDFLAFQSHAFEMVHNTANGINLLLVVSGANGIILTSTLWTRLLINDYSEEATLSDQLNIVART